jgi:precorrin-6A/cobalt-precorrin-6A reductase
MPASAEVLVLGGTAEARALAERLAAHPGLHVTSSLAGRVTKPRLPVGDVRIGGFGGVEGLASYLRQAGTTRVVDATHPFAATISAHAVAACAEVGVPLLVLTRPPYPPDPRWHRVADITAAATAITRPGPVLLTTGRRDLAAFAHLPHRCVIRTVDPPDGPLPADHVLITDRGPYDVSGETALMLEHGVETVVTKDSGGSMTVAKLAAAAALGVDVVMVDRPPHHAGAPDPTHDLDAAVAWCLA